MKRVAVMLTEDEIEALRRLAKRFDDGSDAAPSPVPATLREALYQLENVQRRAE